jgi:colicin import membrane protein
MDAAQATETASAQVVDATAATATEGAAPAADKGFDFKALVSERLGKGKHATEDPADTAAEGEPVKTAEAEGDGEKPAAIEAKPDPKPDPVKAELEERLAKLNEASRRAAEARKAREREQATAKKLKEAEGAHAEEVAMAKRLRESRAKGDALGVLEAAGWTRQEIRDTPIIVSMLEQLENGAKEEPPKPLTESDIEKKFRELEEAKAAEAKAKAEEEAAKAKQQAEDERNEYFAHVRVEFKAGKYPALRSAGTTMGQLESYRATYMRNNPNHAPTAKELLDKAEADLVAFWEKNAAELAKIRGTTPATETAAAKTGEKPAPKRTVTSRMMSDSGGKVPVEEAKPKRDVRAKEKEMKDAFLARFRS